MGTSVGIIARKLPLDLGFAGPVYVSAVLCYTSFAIRAPGDASQVYPFWREVFPTAYATGAPVLCMAADDTGEAGDAVAKQDDRRRGKAMAWTP